MAQSRRSAGRNDTEAEQVVSAIILPPATLNDDDPEQARPMRDLSWVSAWPLAAIALGLVLSVLWTACILWGAYHVCILDAELAVPHVVKCGRSLTQNAKPDQSSNRDCQRSHPRRLPRPHQLVRSPTKRQAAHNPRVTKVAWTRLGEGEATSERGKGIACA